MDEFISITTPDHVTLDFKLAGPASRFGALLIDQVLITLLILGLYVLVALMGIGATAAAGGWAGSFFASLLVLILFAVSWGYFVFFETLMSGQTPGKKMMGLRVVRGNGLPIGLREAAIRNLVRMADMLPPPSYLLGGLVTIADKRGRRLGDMVAGTIVVRERFELVADVASGAAWAARVERGQSRNAVTLPRGTISAAQLGVIEQFLRRRSALTPDKRAELAWQLVEPLLDLLGRDRVSIERHPRRGPECERILTEVLEMARQTRVFVAVTASEDAAGPTRLF